MITPERGLFERIKHECFSPGSERYMRCQENRLEQICTEFEQRLAEAIKGQAAALAQLICDGGSAYAREQILEGRLAEARAKYKDAMADLIFRNTNLKVAHDEIAQLRARCEDLGNIAYKANAANEHWNEFGPEHGFDECMNRLNSALTEIQPQPAQEQKS